MFFTIHYPWHLSAARFSLGQCCGNGIDEEATANAFQAFVNRRLYPLVKNMQHLTRIDAFKLQLSISGTVIEFMQAWNQDALAVLKKVISQKNVSLVQTSYYNSICDLFSPTENGEQVNLHRSKMEAVFGKTTVSVEQNGKVEYLPQDACSLAEKLFDLQKSIKATNDQTFLRNWRLLQDRQYYTDVSKRVLLRNRITNLEVSLIQKRLAKFRFRHPVHSFLL